MCIQCASTFQETAHAQELTFVRRHTTPCQHRLDSECTLHTSISIITVSFILPKISFKVNIPNNAILLRQRNRSRPHITSLCLRTSDTRAVRTQHTTLTLISVEDRSERSILLDLLRDKMPERRVERCSCRPVDGWTVGLASVVFEFKGRSGSCEVTEGAYVCVESPGIVDVPGSCIHFVESVA